MYVHEVRKIIPHKMFYILDNLFLNLSPSRVYNMVKQMKFVLKIKSYECLINSVSSENSLNFKFFAQVDQNPHLSMTSLLYITWLSLLVNDVRLVQKINSS